MRRYPRINSEISEWVGPAALPLFCLAPHGVFHASEITSRAVSSYLAFSPLPALCCQRTGGIFSVALSVTALLQSAAPASFTRHAAVWCSDFPLRIAPERSSAIGAKLTTILEARELRSSTGEFSPMLNWRLILADESLNRLTCLKFRTNARERTFSQQEENGRTFR